MLKKYKIVALLLSMLLIIGIAGCGGSKTSKSKTKKQTSQVVKNVSSVPNNPASQPLTTASVADQEDIPIELRILSPEEFGRDNPFVPLVASAKTTTQAKTSAGNMENYMDPSERKYLPPPTSVVKKPELPDVRLTLVIDGGTAIFEENRSSKVLTVGETVGGMKIQEIRKDGAILVKEDKKYIASPNGRLEEIPSPASVQDEQKQAQKTVKPLKAKKK